MKKVNSNEINNYINSKYGSNSKVLGKLDSGRIVIKTGAGATQTISEADVSNHVITQPNRDKQAYMTEMTRKAKELNRLENEVNAQKKADAQAEISAQVQRQRDRRDIENKTFSDYRV